jgi:hypothetical protein
MSGWRDQEPGPPDRGVERARLRDGSKKRSTIGSNVVRESQYSRNPYRPDQILDAIWAGALEAAKKTEEEIGMDNLGPWDDFE